MENTPNEQDARNEDFLTNQEEDTSGAIHDSDETLTVSKQEYEALLQKVQELEGLKEKLLRSAADFENAKKRLGKERDEFVKFGQESLLRNILPVLDNFERALSHANLSPESENSPEVQHFRNVTTGIQMTYKQLIDILKAQGLNRINALGELYDPHKHEALIYVEGAGREDEVIAEVEPGYMLHDRLLRAAKVNVRSAPKTTEPSSQSHKEE